MAAGTGRHRGPAEFSSAPLVPPDAAWDPAEELAFLLQEAMAEQRAAAPAPEDDPPVPAEASDTFLEDPRDSTAEPVLPRDTPRGHRKVRPRRQFDGVRTASHVTAALAAVTASSVSFFSGMVAYDPLRLVAMARLETGLASWWPMLVYGPWLVASLSVLRAALHQRRAVHSWCVVLLFSAIAMLLCVVQAPRTVVDVAAAALPGLASLACFQQLVRQITLTRPPRRTTPRHRVRRGPQPDAPADAAPTASLPEPAKSAQPAKPATPAKPA
ncbi:DUF2637 domain-containing protein [Streptomyces sp. NPDC046831]|uniref:DUF2637 domain-containing protein n=1 Tax=Streptomyces sp. NPDC046831 TaxID=3154805 RepID=UPI0033D483A7